VVTLLVDVNLDGHAQRLEMRLGADLWRELRDHLDVRFLHFDQAGLDRTAKDELIWRWCQQAGCYLLTANRNLDSDDSLEATIRREGTPQSLPVLTLADPDRLLQSVDYLDRVTEALLAYLLDADNIRGAGRLYLP
jgi:hypothetical protein